MTTQAERDAFEADGFRTEAACQFGFETTNDDANEYRCDEAALIAFAKACERKGMADAEKMLREMAAKFGFKSVVGDDFLLAAHKIKTHIAVLDEELAPILETERVRWLATQGA